MRFSVVGSMSEAACLTTLYILVANGMISALTFHCNPGPQQRHVTLCAAMQKQDNMAISCKGPVLNEIDHLKLTAVISWQSCPQPIYIDLHRAQHTYSVR